MRKVTAGLFLSLDGIVGSPEEWQLPYFNDEMGEAVGASMAAADAMLLGRVTYEEFASYWPGVSSEDQPFAGYMNDTPKYVVSTTLREPLEWNNSTLIKENVAEEIARLKQQPGRNIGITGSATLVRSLLREDLLDELGLMIHPVVVGRGKRLFEEGGEPKGLKLVDSKTFSTGVVFLTYRPAGRVPGGVLEIRDRTVHPAARLETERQGWRGAPGRHLRKEVSLWQTTTPRLRGRHPSRTPR